MKRAHRKPVDLPTFAVLVNASGQIIDVRAHDLSEGTAPMKLKGKTYAEQCATTYRAAIKSLLARQRQLLSAVMPPPTLGLDSWFAVVGVPHGTAKEGGALFVHMDISPWIAADGASAKLSSEISMDLLQNAMATAFVGGSRGTHGAERDDSHYEGIESLTERQREVLNLIGKGKSNAEIADDLSCSLNTVKRHVTAVLQKLKLPNRTRAAMLVNRLGMASDAT